MSARTHDDKTPMTDLTGASVITFMCVCVCCRARLGTQISSREEQHNRQDVRASALIPHPTLFGRQTRTQPSLLTLGLPYKNIVYVSIPRLHGFIVMLHQFDMFGAFSTGAVLWSCEVLAAELLVTHFRAHSAQPFKLRMLELGCGTSPVAGFCAAALSHEVVLTDMPVVLKGVAQNLQLNAQMFGRLLPDRDRSRSPCQLETLEWGKFAAQDAKRLGTFDLFICSECVFRPTLHPLLADVCFSSSTMYSLRHCITSCVCVCLCM